MMNDRDQVAYRMMIMDQDDEQKKTWASSPQESFDEDEQGCLLKAGKGLVTGFMTGSLLGAIFSNWSDVPVVLRDKPWPALVRTGGVMVQHGSTLGAVGLAFAAVDCASESVRGEKDWVNGVLGGLAGGALLGLRSGNPRLGVLSMGALAATSAVVDMSGHSLRGGGFRDEGTPVRRTFPYAPS
ncbi:Outer envelope pore protein 16-3/mitochondrial [Picochlorum sp. SENEW3]|nr:Outer envelope pore protein 16-3/mitochondrial [Picochlorum sp. SENEW3]